MKAVDWLKNMRDSLVNKKEEVEDIELEDHEVGEGNIFKLHYVNFHRIGYRKTLGVVDWYFDPFIIPDGMDRSNAFKVLSYLTDYIEKNTDLEECSLGSVKALNQVIDLERFGFRRVKNKVDAISLYTVSGRLEPFKKSEYYKTYFEWYTPDVTREEVVNIYENIGMPFSDIVIGEKTSIKQLKF